MTKYVVILIQAGLILLLNCQQSTAPVTPPKTLDDYDTQYRMLVKDYPNLFTMNSDGTNRTEILNYAGAHIQEATVNSDFSKIAFTATLDGSPMNIYIMNIDGSDLRRLSNHPSEHDNLTPRFIPGKQALIYHAYDALRKVNYDGSANELITPDSIWIPGQNSSVSKDNIVFGADILSDGTLLETLGIMNAEGTDLQYHIDGGGFHDPAISPDGAKVCFVDKRDVYVMNLDGSEKINLTNDPSNDIFPGWTPDGNKISYVSNRDGDYQIYIVDLDGRNLRKIPNISEKRPFQFTCSPDLTRISYVTFTESPNYRNGIFMIDIETGERIWFTSGIENPLWLNRLQ